MSEARVKRRYTKMLCREIDELNRAYIAGLLDADGSIGIHKQLAYGRWTRYTLTVRIANTDARLIKHLIDVVGGGISEDIKHQRKLVCYFWTITAVAALEFLQQVVPYLISKREEAEAAIIFQQRRGINGKHKSLLDREIDEILYNRCKDLKQERGVHISRGGAL